MVTQMSLLRFQMCAVVNRITVLHLRHRHRKSRMPRVVTITDTVTQTSQIFRRQLHAFTHPPAPPRSPFNSHRSAASPKPVAVLYLRYRHRKSGMPRVVTITVTDERNLSEATSRIHTSAGAATIAVQLAPKRGIAKGKALQVKDNRPYSAPRDCFFQIPEHPVLPQQQPVSSNSASYMSCPCLVSFSVGPYDVLVSTPDSIFSVASFHSIKR